MKNLRAYSTGSLVALQHRLNRVFVRLRDGGENIAFVYKHLSRVEHELALRRVYW